MKKKTFLLLTAVLTVCAVLTTAAFAVTERSWFRTDTGTGLNLVLDWDVERTAEAVSVTVDLALEHYAVHVGARRAQLAIGEHALAVDVPAIRCDENVKLSRTSLCADTVVIPRAAGEVVEIPIRASWHFGGVYAGKELGLLEVEKTLVIDDTTVTVREGTAGDAVVTTTPAVPEVEAGPAEPDAPVGGPAYSQRWEFRSDNGTWLNLIFEVEAADALELQGALDVSYRLVLEYYSLWMSEKVGTLTVGNGQIVQKFTAPAVAEGENVPHRIVLAQGGLSAVPGQEIDFSASMPFNGVYSGKPLEEVFVAGSVVLG